MKQSRIFLLGAGSALCAFMAVSCGKAPQLTADNASEVLARMTTNEKIDMVVGAGNETFTGYGNTKKLVPGAAGTTSPVARLGVPPTALTDGPAGLRIDTMREGQTRRYYHTGFPIGTALASSWNEQLITEVGQAIGNEAHEYGLDLIFGPGMNLHRDPLGGRNFEYFSEDPLLTGKMAAAYVRGIQSQQVGACLKHFAVNNQETNRKDVDVRIAQRPLRELYLRPFEIAVRESNPWSVMSAYNMINGQQCMESRDLLTTVLREDMGFQGFVVSDWAAPGWRDSGKEIWAGNDLLAPGTPQQRQEIKDALKAKTLNMAALDSCALRMLRFVGRTTRITPHTYGENPDLKAHAEKSRQAAEEGIILLENHDATLPLSTQVKSVAMFGVSSYNFISVGTGSGNVKTPHTVDLIEGFTHTGINTDASLENLYRQVIRDTIAARAYDPLGYSAIPEIPMDTAAIKRSAQVADVAIITIGRSCGEGADRLESTEYRLSDVEHSLIADVSRIYHAAGKRVVVVLNVSGVVEVASWRNQVDAVVLSWLPGQEAGDAVCRMLTGRVCPSGKLTMTFPLCYEDCSTHDNFPYDFHGPKAIGNYPKIPRNPAIKNVHYVDYVEGMYVGYRYFDTFNRPVAYPFGYGQSYTTFSYSAATCTQQADGNWTVSVKVTNTGNYAGKEVVQIYAPVLALSHQLVAFGKTGLLQPGKSQTLQVLITPRDLSYFDETENAWVLAAGEYKLEVSASARDVRQTASINIPTRKVLERVASVLK